MDWDDVRYFLSVARKGSVRAAAEALKVNHATVLRRIGQLEEQLGVQLFEKLPSGYRLTKAGEEVLSFAEDMEVSSNRIRARIYGRDKEVSGPLRVTMPPVVASHLLMDDLATFKRDYPDIELEILSIDHPLNLTNREADVAIRNVYDRAALPNNLHGLKGPDVFWSVYVSRALMAQWREGQVEDVPWILKDQYGHPDWCRRCEIPQTNVPFRVMDAGAQIAAVQRGVGMTLMPCFIGDPDPLLVRVPGADVKMKGTFWMLTQGETRKTRRVRVFVEFVSRRLAAYQSLLAGREAQRH